MTSPTRHILRSASALIASLGLLVGLAACSSQPQQQTTASDARLAQTQKQVQSLQSKSIAFIGIGPFGGFLSALESDTRDTLAQVGYSVSYSSVNRKNHLAQVEKFEQALSSRPDAILLAPTQNTGWAGELRKARRARIPVILVAHHLSKKEEKLVTTFVGPSDIWAGRQAASYIASLYDNGLRSSNDTTAADSDASSDAGADGLNGVVLAGPTGQRQSQDRTDGWDDRISQNTDIHVLTSVAGDWTQDTAYATMTGLLAQYADRDLRFVYAQSDAMAIGAARAIADAGKSGTIHVVSIDGTKAGLQAVINGSIDRSVEYNPLIGQKVSETLTRVLQGKTVPDEVTVSSRVFDAAAARAALPTRQY
jgi:ABC-type sugar transport system substrate-binding protein